MWRPQYKVPRENTARIFIMSKMTVVCFQVQNIVLYHAGFFWGSIKWNDKAWREGNSPYWRWKAHKGRCNFDQSEPFSYDNALKVRKVIKSLFLKHKWWNLLCCQFSKWVHVYILRQWLSRHTPLCSVFFSIRKIFVLNTKRFQCAVTLISN